MVLDNTNVSLLVIGYNITITSWLLCFVYHAVSACIAFLIDCTAFTYIVLLAYLVHSANQSRVEAVLQRDLITWHIYTNLALYIISG